MFELAEIGNSLSKEEHKKQEQELRPALIEAQQEMKKQKKFAVIVIIGGVEGAGKTETVNFLSSWLDPRGVEVNAFGPLSEEEKERPRLYRFWRALPPKGKIGIFFGSWYTDPIVARAFKTIKKVEFVNQLQQINSFESHLHDEGVLIIKFWLHLSKKAQIRRHKKLSKDPKKSWRLSKLDKEYFKLYNRFYKVSEGALRITSTGAAAWNVIESENDEYREITVARTLLDAIKNKLKEKPREAPQPMPIPKVQPHSPLDNIDLSKKMSKAEHLKKVEKLQGEINILSNKAFERGISSVLVFEGWDAGGKGGNIRRLTMCLDAWHYRVISIAAPSQAEKAQPYLWRFWMHLPRDGRIAIFDRSWYGRVLVERVEGFCQTEDWQRAYSEINDFETQIVGSGCVLVKYWLHVSKEEQLRRFNERKKIAYKNYKITDEDWRNREKWNAYLVAVDEMLARTSTDVAPWTIISANDKYYARVQGLRSYRDALARALKKSGKKVKSPEALKLS